MGAEILDDTHVSDSGWEWPLPSGGDLVDVPQIARLDSGSCLLKGWVVPLDVTDSPDEAVCLEGLGNSGRGGRVLGEWLLDEGGDTGLGKGQTDALVVDRGYGDHAVVEAVFDEGLYVGLHWSVPGHTMDITSRVGNGHEVDTAQTAEDTSMVSPHHPEADEASTQIRHQAPAFARVFTAVTTRSTCSEVREGCTGSERHSRAARSVSGRATSI